jgi:hypothetical protein
MSTTEDKNKETEMLVLQDSGVYYKVCLDNHRYLILKPHFEMNTYIFSTKILNSKFDRELKIHFIFYAPM